MNAREAAELRSIAVRLRNLADGVGEPGVLAPGPAEIAAAEYRDRRSRETLFGRDLFGEEAWDMMLELYVGEAAGSTATVTQLSRASRGARTTALRWLGILEREGLVAQNPSISDGRVVYLTLTPAATRSMTAYLLGKAG